MIWARWAGVMGVPMKWEIARIFVVGTGGSGFCAEAAPSGVIGFFMAVAPYSSFLYRNFKPPFFPARAISPDRWDVKSSFWLMKIPMLLRLDRAAAKLEAAIKEAG